MDSAQSSIFSNRSSLDWGQIASDSSGTEAYRSQESRSSTTGVELAFLSPCPAAGHVSGTQSEWSKKKETVKRYLMERSCAVMDQICKNSVEAMVLDSRSEISPPEKGVFSAMEYFQLMKRHGQTTRDDWLRANGCYYSGWAPKEYFDRIVDESSPTGFAISGFKVKKDQSPSDALDAIVRGLSLIGCVEVCQISYYIALRDLLQKEKFDVLFSGSSKTPLVIHGLGMGTGIALDFLLEEGASFPIPSFEKGDMVHFKGAARYKDKHRFGSGAGLCTLCCASDREFRFSGLEIGPNSRFSSIVEWLRREYDKPPIEGVLTSEQSNSFYQPRISPDSKLSAAERLTINKVICWNCRRVAMLVDASVERAREQMDYFYMSYP